MALPRPLRPRNLGAALGLARRVRPRELLERRIVLRVEGFEIEVPRDRLWAFRDGTYYERNVRHWWLRALSWSPNPVVYDLGAHGGYYALAAASRASAVYAFEPAPETFALLERNIRRNGLQHVRAFPLAAGEREAEAELNLYTASGNNSLVPRALPHLVPHGSATVQTARLDDLAGLRPPTLIKLDVEGSELAALRGARRLLGEAKPVVFMEYWEEGARNAGHSLDDLAAELDRHDYRLVGLGEDHDDLLLHPREDWARVRIGNVVALPRTP